MLFSKYGIQKTSTHTMKNIFVSALLAVTSGITIFTVNAPSSYAESGSDVIKGCKRHCDDLGPMIDNATSYIRKGVDEVWNHRDTIKRTIENREQPEKLYENMKQSYDNQQRDYDNYSEKTRLRE
jgi:hypothetical protein